jgi:hypothetical protein
MRRKDPSGKKRFYADFVWLSFYVHATDILEKRNWLWLDFLSLVVNEQDFTPERYDPDEEPPRYAFNASNLSDLMRILMDRGEHVLLERYDPYYMFYTIDTGTIMAAGPIISEGLSVETQYFENREKIKAFLDFSKKLFCLFGAHYGEISHKKDDTQQSTIYTYFPPGHPSAGKVYSQTGFGGDTSKGIPGVYWANFFGRIYVEMIGRQKFLSAPCFQREELEDGGFLLLTSENPLDWDKPEVQELRKAMRDHLGYEYFCDISNRERVCKVPPFDFSVWEKECERGMKVPDRFKDLSNL